MMDVGISILPYYYINSEDCMCFGWRVVKYGEGVGVMGPIRSQEGTDVFRSRIVPQTPAQQEGIAYLGRHLFVWYKCGNLVQSTTNENTTYDTT